MSRYNPYKNIDKFLITERSLNHILRPVQVRKENYPYTYTIENMGNKVEITVDRVWTSSNHVVLDFIGRELFEREYKDVKKRNTWKNDLSQSLLYNFNKLIDLKNWAVPPYLSPYISIFEELQKIKALNNQQRITELEDQIGIQNLHDLEDLARRWSSVKLYIVEFNRHQFIERYKIFFKGRRAENLNELIKRTAAVTFSLEYPIRTPVIKEYDNKGKTSSKIVETRLENLKIENNKIFNYKIENDTIKIAFNTFLGRAYAHNLLTLNTDWFEEDFLKLDGYASAIYRHFFVIKSGNKVDQLPVKNIVDYFDMLKNPKYPEVIKKAFEDIKNAGLIADYKLNINGGKFSKGWVEVKK